MAKIPDSQEKFSAVEMSAGESEETFKIDSTTGLYDGVQRNMKQRHIQMFALAGVRLH